MNPEPHAPGHLRALPSFSHRGNGKIARLPKTVRDQINNYLLDGLSYPDIIKRLGEHGKHLNPRHFSEYKKRGYQDWLSQREWFEYVTATSGLSKDILASPDTATLHGAGLRLAATQMFDQFLRLNQSPHTRGANPGLAELARLVNALSRLSREALAFQKHNDPSAKARSTSREFKDPNRKLTESETRAIVCHVDRIPGLDSFHEPESPTVVADQADPTEADI